MSSRGAAGAAIVTQERADLSFVALCVLCGDRIPSIVLVAGRRLDLRDRKRCLRCLPHRPLHGPRRTVVRASRPKICDACGVAFPRRTVVGGVLRNLPRRRFCLVCSPFGQHNSSAVPPGSLSTTELAELRRKKRNAKTYRYQKKMRLRL